MEVLTPNLDRYEDYPQMGRYVSVRSCFSLAGHFENYETSLGSLIALIPPSSFHLTLFSLAWKKES